jgi:hypothetical protein
MKRRLLILIPLIIICIAVVLAFTAGKDNVVKPIKLSNSEQTVFDLSSGYNDSGIYSYSADTKTISRGIIALEVLSGKGKWQVQDQAEWKIKKGEGNADFYVGYTPGKGGFFKMKTKKVGQRFDFPVRGTSGKGFRLVQDQTCRIKKGKKIALMMFTGSDAGTDSGIINEYYKSKALTKYGNIVAVTIEFE